MQKPFDLNAAELKFGVCSALIRETLASAEVTRLELSVLHSQVDLMLLQARVARENAKLHSTFAYRGKIRQHEQRKLQKSRRRAA